MEKIHALTSLRFFAALLVVFYHTIWLVIPSMTHHSLAGRFFSMGFVSVSFFFLLSGYILAMVYLRTEQPLNKSSFYLARFARIYPLFLITLILDTPNLFLDRIAHYGLTIAALKTAATFAANLVMLQAWVLQLRGIDNPNWSLSVETLFYLIFPLIGAWFWKLKGSRLWLSAFLLWILGQLLVLLVSPFTKGDSASFYPPLHVSTFLLGILIAKLQTQKLTSTPHVTTTMRTSMFLFVSSMTTMGVVAYWFQVIPPANLSDGLLAPLFACFIWVFADNRFFLSKLLSAKWLVTLGEASFGLYLIHLPVAHLFDRLHISDVPALYPVYLVTCIGLSVLSFYYIETPSRTWILRHFRKRSKETLEAASDAQ